ncbi:MAG TPA: penicillin-binding transpeptidase domain-containing protein [Clostridiaceae bacterium]
MDDMSSSIKKVLVVFLFFFFAVITYITYFEIAVAPKIVNSTLNKRTWVKRNEVLRGTIYDRNMVALTKSEKVDELTQKRQYTGNDVFAHVLGYVNIKYGITGLEKKYDSELMADDTSILDIFNIDKNPTPKVGHNLITTLDSKLQSKAYELLGDNIGAIVALDPKTGEILALVSKPSYDPNNLEKIWTDLNKNKNSPLINRATAGLYPPGSTFKIITALSALENIGGIQNRTFKDNGKLVFNSKESLSNFGGEVLGNLSFRNAFIHSSNVVFGGLGEELGNTKLKTEAEKFYFNANIPSDGVTIENSMFPKLAKNEIGNIAQSAIGQSTVLATPMEMALVAATIANGGVMMEPYLVKEVTKSDGTKIKAIEGKPIGTIISPSNSSIMKDLMLGVVKEGTGTNANVPGIEICGKTGTADHKEGGGNLAPHAWFVGFAPYASPTIALAIIVEDGGQGGIIAANIASGLIKEYLGS